MSSETIVTALFLIAAVVAAGVLISALFPAIHRTTSTFGAVSHEADTQIRTDFKIVNAFANASAANIWLKNVGSSRLHLNEIQGTDVFIGGVGDFDRVAQGKKAFSLDDSSNQFWDPGETLTIRITDIADILPDDSGTDVYVGVVLPNGVRRDLIFPRS